MHNTSLTFSSQRTSPSSCVSVATLASPTKGTQRNLMTWTLPAIQTCFIIKNTRSQLNLYIYRDEETFKEPMYLISNVYQDAEIHHCYKRRMQIEHGFRDIKTRFGFRHIVLKKLEKARIALLWFIACLTYGLTFLCYEKDIQPVAEHRNTRRKLHAVITLIKDVLMETWTPKALLTALEMWPMQGRYTLSNLLTFSTHIFKNVLDSIPNTCYFLM